MKYILARVFDHKGGELITNVFNNHNDLIDDLYDSCSEWFQQLNDFVGKNDVNKADIITWISENPIPESEYASCDTQEITGTIFSISDKGTIRNIGFDGIADLIADYTLKGNA